ncbi:ABC transporter ATP-binding protein [Aestuariicella hydrocarbonica]|uniref:ABC transporter ATP-binding protein n=1 Tax=Pseudomaricurvus hydrocarbonicus TaxID=1470433 RepID=A0A9E5MHC6_9GAMM|nr:ABC transporter ATP-binding protein [Aestuariicella hydrocarbonica]
MLDVHIPQPKPWTVEYSGTVLSDHPKRESNWQFFLRYVLRHKWSYGTGVILLLATNWFAVSIPRYIGASIDLLKEQLPQHQGELNTLILLIAGLALMMMATRTLSRMLFFNPGRAVERDLKNEAFTQLTHLQRDFFERHPTGTLISIVNNDINGIRALAGVVMLQVFNITFALSLTPYKMWQLSPQLTLYCMVPVVATFLVSHRAIGRMRQMMKVRMEELQALSSHSVELLSGIEVIKSNRIQGWARDEFAQGNDKLLRRSLQLARIRTLVLPILGYTDRIMKVLILAVGGVYVIQSGLSLGEVVAFLSYATLLAMPFFSMAMIFSSFQNGILSIESLRKILDSDIPPQDHQHLPDAERQQLFSSGVSIRNLSYTYPGQAEPALKGISFDIRPGQTIGILGQVGSGKSTLVNCINRHLEIEPGRIFIDDYDITQLSRRDLRSAVRTITQEPFLFSDSVVNNIRFSAGDEESQPIDDVLYQSDLQDEVDKFPAGEDTLVGEKGILLSGGQKQRLSLARAMYTPSKLMILDNVLSAVDNDTERFLLGQIFDHMQSQSILIVSHRASVLERVDYILVMDQGAVVAQGTHRELLERSPLYRQTWQLQAAEQQGQEEPEAQPTRPSKDEEPNL